MAFEYIIKYYDVPACLGRIVEYNGKQGIIAEDRGNYIGVNFDSDKPGHVCSMHPKEDTLVYLGMGVVRPMTRGQARYKRYLEYGDCFDTFLHFCRWDADPQHEWNIKH